MTPFPSTSVAQRAWSPHPKGQVFLLTCYVFGRITGAKPKTSLLPVLALLPKYCQVSSVRGHELWRNTFQEPSPEHTQTLLGRKQIVVTETGTHIPFRTSRPEQLSPLWGFSDRPTPMLHELSPDGSREWKITMITSGQRPDCVGATSFQTRA